MDYWMNLSFSFLCMTNVVQPLKSRSFKTKNKNIKSRCCFLAKDKWPNLVDVLQDHLSLDGDLSNSNDSLSADNTKVNVCMFLAQLCQLIKNHTKHNNLTPIWTLFLQEKGSKFGGMFKGWTKGANDQAEVWFCRVAFLSPGSSYIMHILCIYSIPMNINSLHIVSPPGGSVCVRGLEGQRW